MPKKGNYDKSYPQKLKDINISIVGEFKGSKKHHLLKCDECGNEWDATPISKLQNYKKHQYTGCPSCIKHKQHKHKREANIQTIKQKYNILSHYDGKDSTTIKIKVQHKKCKHTFETAPGNLLHRNIDCTVCGIKQRTKNINNWSIQNSIEWGKTADVWKIYKSEVISLTAQNYKRNKDIINPENLPRGLAGTEGAFQLDHIVPIRYCFDNNILVEICSHPTNLQMLGWRENVGSRDILKEGVDIPGIFKQWIR